MSLVLANAHVVSREGIIERGWVEVDAKTIVAVGRGRPPPAPVVDLSTRWLVPGFVDVHVHGGGGASYDSGDAESALQVRDFHRRHGTTTSVASLVTAPLDAICRAAEVLAELVDAGELAGIHLEGPFLSPARSGAHDPSLLRPPLREDLVRLMHAGRGAVRMVTIAPELDGGLDAIRTVVDHGAVAAIGHTAASYEVTVAALQAGARHATHLFNGMPPPHHREPGPVLALSADDRVTIELIHDGLHVHPALVREVLARLPGRVSLVTDAIVATGVGNGTFWLGGRRIRVRDGLATTVDGESIAGSTLTMDVVLRNTVHAGVAVSDAVMATSATPAAVLGLDHAVGAIAPGLNADLVVLDEQLRLERVMLKGTWLS